MNRPLGIDLFAGVGGLALGFEQSGFDIVAAVEIDPIHAAAHKFNFPLCAVISQSVVGLSAKSIREAAGIGTRNIAVVFGGAPCQGFSLIGQRALEDPRNALVREFVRLAELNASYFVFENVKGLTIGKHKKFLEELIEAFEKFGYTVRLPWEVLNSAEYGVPQRRERLILMGATAGLPLPAYPDAVCLSARNTRSHSLLPIGPTCRDAIADLPEAEDFEELLDCDEVATGNWGLPSPYASSLRCHNPADWYSGYRRHWNLRLLTSSMRTHHTAISRRRFSATPLGEIEPISRFFKLSPENVCNTLRAGTDSARGAFTSPRPIHYSKPRCITVREMARLHGFPDWFRFHATKWHGARQIGNAVPPPLARAIGKSILSALGMPPTAPTRVLRLGDPELIRMDMSEAAAHFGIAVPINRRDRKSGAKKRKQKEIEQILLSDGARFA